MRVRTRTFIITVVLMLSLLTVTLAACGKQSEPTATPVPPAATSAPTEAATATSEPTATPQPTAAPSATEAKSEETTDADNPLAALSDKQKDVKTARLSLKANMIVPELSADQKVAVTGEGEKVGDDMHLKLTMEGAIPGMPTSTGDSSGEAQGFEIEMVMSKGTAYFSLFGQWMKLPSGGETGALPLDPSEISGATDLKDTTDVKKDGTEDVRGTKCTVYTFKVKEDALKSIQPKAGEGSVELTMNEGKAYIDDDGFLRKMTINVQGKSSDGKAVEMDTEVEFWDINQSLPEITAPPNAVEFNMPAAASTPTS